MIDETMLVAMENMAKALERLQSQFLTVRTGRPNSALFEKIPVDYYGATVPMVQLVTFQVPDARTLVIKPHDKGSIQAIERAIQESDLGVTPGNDGVVVRINFPLLTEDRRKEFVKVVKNMAEDGRIALRNVRRDARKALEVAEKDGEISKDELDRAEKDLEKLTHDHSESLDKALARKEQELLEI